MRKDMTREEKDDLIGKVTELTERNVLKVDDYVQILAVCQRACARRIGEIDEVLKPEGPVQ